MKNEGAMFLKDLLLKDHEIDLLYLKVIYYLSYLSYFTFALSSIRLATEESSN